jgi:uncharacterized protein
MPRVIHFEIHADDPERAVRFYEQTLGWQFQKWDGPLEYWMVITGQEGPGINGGMLRRMYPISGEGVIAYVCTVDTDSVDALLDKITGAGGTVAVPKMPIPGMGWLAYAKDTEGNIFGMMENDPSAA